MKNDEFIKYDHKLIRVYDVRKWKELMNRFIRCLFVALLLAFICGCTQMKSPLKDGKYFGYEFMCNLTPTEDPDALWYHAGVLRVHQGTISLQQYPCYLSHGQVISSASDGGFFVFDGKVEIVGKRVIVSLRKASCDYCAILANDPLPSKIVREYVVRFIEDGSFELNGVVYRAQPDPKLEWKPQ